MLKAIIVDDEQHCINRLEELLQEHKEEIQIVSCCKTLEEAKRQIGNFGPDILFLDVHLGDVTGFDLLKQLDTIDFELIFTTSFDSYALQAFKFSALDYLLKPIDKDDLKEAVNRVQQAKKLKETSQKIDVLFHNFKDGAGTSKRIAVPTMDGFAMVDVKDIIRLQSDGNYTHIYTTSNKRITAARTLKHFEGLLDTDAFFRTHKSHLVNLSFVDNYLKGKGGYVVLSDGTKVEVAVRRKEELIQKLMPNS